MNKNLRLIVSFIGNDKLSGSLRSIIGLGETASQKLAMMKKGARELEKELRGVQLELGNSSGNVTDLLSREADLEKRIAATNRQMERQVKLLQIQTTVDRVTAQGEAMKSAGTENMMEGAAMAAPLIFMAKSASDYEKKLALIAQKTDLNRNQTEKFGRSLLATANATKQSSDAMLESADFLTGKGLNADVVNSMLPDIGRFATAWNANVVDASKAAYAGFLSLKVPLAQTARSLEIMAIAGKEGGFEVKDMAQYFPQLTSSMSSLGSKGLTAVADLSAALQVLEAKTGDGAVAANNLDNLLGFVKSKEGIKNFAKAGVDIPAALKKAAAEGRSPLETIIDLVNKATGGDTSKIPQIIGDRQAGAAALALVTSSKKYQEIKAAALSTLGMTEKEYNRMSETSGANLVSMQTSLTTLGMALGAHLLPMMNAATKGIANTVNAVGAWAAANPETASAIMTIVTAMVGFKLGLGALQFAVGGLFGPFATLLGWYKRLKVFHTAFATWGGIGRILTAVGGSFTRAATVIRTAAMFMAKGVMRAGMFMMANPIILILAGIAAAVYLIYRNWDTIGPYFSKAWAAVTGFFTSGIGNITATLVNFSPMGLLYAGFAKLLSWMGISIPAQLSTVGTNIVQGLWRGILAGKDWLMAKLRWFATLIPEPIRRALGIHSPSRVFAQIGGHVMSGLDQGLAANTAGPLSRISSLSGQMTKALGVGAIGTAIAASGPAFAAPPMIAPAPIGVRADMSSAVPASPPPQQVTYTIQVSVSGGAPASDIAQQVREAIEQIERERRGRSFGDN